MIDTSPIDFFSTLDRLFFCGGSCRIGLTYWYYGTGMDGSQAKAKLLRALFVRHRRDAARKRRLTFQDLWEAPVEDEISSRLEYDETFQFLLVTAKHFYGDATRDSHHPFVSRLATFIVQITRAIERSTTSFHPSLIKCIIQCVLLLTHSQFGNKKPFKSG